MSGGFAAAFVVARLGSSRFPGKQLRTIGGTSILEWIVNALKQCRLLDRIVLATVARRENEPLRDWARQHHIDCFWYDGPIDHVTTRLRSAADHYTADICLLISADCPLIDAVAVDTLINQLKKHPEADYITLPNIADNLSCMLQGVQVARCDSWQRGDDLSDRPELKEHQFPIFSQRRDLFTPLPCQLDPRLYGQSHRLSVDTWSDLQFLNRIYTVLREQGLEFNLGNAVSLLQQQPQLKAINQHVHQKRLIEDTQRVLLAFAQPPQPDIYSNTLHLALQIVDRLGWPVSILNADLYAEELNERGMRNIPFNVNREQISNIAAQFDLFFLVSNGDTPSWWDSLSHHAPHRPLVQLHLDNPPRHDQAVTLPQQDDEAAILRIIATIKAFGSKKTHP